MDRLTTTDDVIEALGGPDEVAKLLGRRSHSAVSNWRTTGRGKFPCGTYLILLAALEAQGKTAPPSLWGIAEPASASEAA